MAEKEYQDIYNLIGEMKTELTQIREALLGNPIKKDGGISDTVIQHEKRIRSLEEKASLAKYLFLGIGITGGAAGSFLSKIISKLLT